VASECAYSIELRFGEDSSAQARLAAFAELRQITGLKAGMGPARRRCAQSRATAFVADTSTLPTRFNILSIRPVALAPTVSSSRGMGRSRKVAMREAYFLAGECEESKIELHKPASLHQIVKRGGLCQWESPLSIMKSVGSSRLGKPDSSDCRKDGLGARTDCRSRSSSSRSAADGFCDFCRNRGNAARNSCLTAQAFFTFDRKVYIHTPLNH
jgi:hypothetical protein